jgi:hypothetical protein
MKDIFNLQNAHVNKIKTKQKTKQNKKQIQQNKTKSLKQLLTTIFLNLNCRKKC